GDLQRQPCLAKAAHAEQREKARTREQLLRLLALTPAANERRDLLRQIVGRCLELAQRGKILMQRRMEQLIDGFGCGETFEPHRAQAAERNVARQASVK